MAVGLTDAPSQTEANGGKITCGGACPKTICSWKNVPQEFVKLRRMLYSPGFEIKNSGFSLVLFVPLVKTILPVSGIHAL